MTALVMIALEMFAPSLLGGSLGITLGILRNPMAGKIIKFGKAGINGDHLSTAEKETIKRYNAGRTDSQMVHGAW